MGWGGWLPVAGEQLAQALDVEVRWTPLFGQDCVKLNYGDHDWEWGISSGFWGRFAGPFLRILSWIAQVLEHSGKVVAQGTTCATTSKKCSRISAL